MADPSYTGCAVCAAPAAVLVAGRYVHEAFAGRPPIYGPDVRSDPQWRCAGCLEATLRTGRWAALGPTSAAADRGAVEDLAAIDGASSPWAQLCVRLGAVPDRMTVSVTQRPATPGVWLVLILLGEIPDFRSRTERAFDGIESAVEAIAEALDAIAAADAHSVPS